jgi:Cgr1 family
MVVAVVAVATNVKLGPAASGRTWKKRIQTPARCLTNTKYNNRWKSWDDKQVDRKARQLALELQKELSEQKRLEIIDKKERRLENEKRRAENEYKTVSRAAQTLNHSKVGYTLKAMSKKQLRQIKKTRVNPKTGVTEFVSAYAK